VGEFVVDDHGRVFEMMLNILSSFRTFVAKDKVHFISGSTLVRPKHNGVWGFIVEITWCPACSLQLLSHTVPDQHHQLALECFSACEKWQTMGF
jgi:hypothetical protein